MYSNVPYNYYSCLYVTITDQYSTQYFAISSSNAIQDDYAVGDFIVPCVSKGAFEESASKCITCGTNKRGPVVSKSSPVTKTGKMHSHSLY